MKKLLILLLFPFFCFSQFAYYNKTTAWIDFNFSEKRFQKSENGKKAINLILSAADLKKNFIVVACTNLNCPPDIRNNAVAYSYQGLNYIIYDSRFLEEIADKSTSWSKIWVLAHEVGHHIYGHTRNLNVSKKEMREQELEADWFAGHILYKLGASLENTVGALDYFASDFENYNSTHPSKEKRIKSTKNGYVNAKNTRIKQKISQSKQLLYDAYKLYENNQLEDAISKISEAINKNPNYIEAFYYRGIIYTEIEKFKSAKKDFNTALKINENYADGYIGRGIIYTKIGKYIEAERDFEKALEIEPNNYNAYINLGNNYAEKGALGISLEKYLLAIFINDKIPTAYCNLGVSLWNQGKKYKDLRFDNKTAKDYFDIAINLDNKFKNGYKNRGLWNLHQGNKRKACIDFKKTCELGDCNEYYLHCK